MKKALLTFVSLCALLFAFCFSASAVENVTFDTSDGGKSSIYSADYDLTINVFGVCDLVYTEDFLNFLLSEGIDQRPGIKINFIDTNGEDKDRIEQFRKEKFCKAYPDNKISFCYSTSHEGTYTKDKLIDAYGEDIDSSNADICYIDKNGTILCFDYYLQEQSETLKIINYNNILTEPVSFSVKGKENYDYAYEALNKLNELRASVNLPALTMDKELLDVAMQRAAEIAIYYSHTRPNGSSCFTAFSKPGTSAENIALGQKTPSDVTDDWKNSPGHYSNMTNSSVKSVGIGVFEASDGTLCWVQFFHSGETEHFVTSGTKEATRPIAADFRKLKLSFGPEKDTVQLLKKGETVPFFVYNTNIETNTLQKLSAEDFIIKCADNTLSVGENNAVTVNAEVPFDTQIKISYANNPVVYYDTSITVGHSHKFLFLIAYTLTHGCGYTEIETYYFCETCLETKKENTVKSEHELTEVFVYKPATETEDGKMGLICRDCGRNKETDTIPKIAKIDIPQTEFIYEGEDIVPTVTVTDSTGYVLKENTDYKIELYSGSSPVGNCRYRIYFINKYSGEHFFDITVRTDAPSKLILTTEKKGTALSAEWVSVPGALVYNVELIKDNKVITTVKVEGTSWIFEDLTEGAVYQVRVTSFSCMDNLLSPKSITAEAKIPSASSENPSEKPSGGSSDEKGQSGHIHTEIIIPAVPATFTSSGKTEGKKCSECGKVTVKQKKVAKKKLKKAKISSVKSSKKKTAVLTWKKVTGASGYIIEYSTSKKFTKKTTKTVKIKKGKTTKATLKKLKSGKKYYIRIKAYKNVGKKTVYGSVSSIKSVKVK